MKFLGAFIAFTLLVVALAVGWLLTSLPTTEMRSVGGENFVIMTFRGAEGSTCYKVQRMAADLQTGRDGSATMCRDGITRSGNSLVAWRLEAGVLSPISSDEFEAIMNKRLGR